MLPSCLLFLLAYELDIVPFDCRLSLWGTVHQFQICFLSIEVLICIRVTCLGDAGILQLRTMALTFGLLF